MNLKATVLTISALSAGLIQAATISWGAPTAITGTLADFDLDGSFHEAYSGDNNLITVDPGGLNIPFNNVGQLANGVFPSADPVVRTDALYDALLQNATWAGGNTTLNLGSQAPLISGNMYQVQIWVADTRGCCSNRQKSYGDAAGIAQVTLNSGSTAGVNTQMVVGTFTADASTQTLSFIGSGSTHPQYNAIMVRAVPEPSTLGLTALTGLAFLRRRRS